MAQYRNLFRSCLCIALGAALGGMVGYGVMEGFGVNAKWAYVEDPSGIKAIVLVSALPLGLFIGGILGGLCADRWRGTR